MSDQSLMSRMGAAVLPYASKLVFPADWATANESQLLTMAKKRRAADGPRPDLVLGRKWGRATTDVAGRELHLFTPKSGSTGRVLYYCHGGAFIIGPSALEWLFAAKVADALGVDLAFYDYPKTPEHDSTDILPANLAAYDVIAERYPADQQLIGGTSAGGALTLTTLLQLHRAGRQLPQAALLLSPWLDVSVSHPDIADYTETDKLLPVDCLRRDGALYAGPVDTKDPLLSPFFMSAAELAALPPLVITVGEQEILMPETQGFVDRVKSAGGSVSLHTETYGQHAGVLIATPESSAALDDALAALSPLVPAG